jgi:predicted transcriptional regulator
MRYNVVMDATKPTSLRIPEEIIKVADEIAKSEERSRAQILVRTLRDGLLGGNLSEKRNEGADRGIRAVAAQKKSAGKENSATAEKGGAIKSNGGKVGKKDSGASGEVAVGAGWYPNSMCPHGYQNSFACEKAGKGCTR